MRTLLLLALVLVCAGCAGGQMQDLPRESAAFKLSVLPQSYAVGGSASDVTVKTRADGDGIAVEIVGRADGLKAFYFDLGYDATQWRPVSVDQHLGIADNSLQLAVTTDPGTVHAGRILTNPDTQPGVSGALTLATVHFVPGAATSLRAVSTPPSRPASASVLTITAGVLDWHFYSQGDYDQNGEVNIADLTPIAIHFHETGPFDPNSIQAVVDGDSNGEINIADLTPMAPNFLAQVAGYAVYRSQSLSDYPSAPDEAPKVSPLVTIPLTSATGDKTLVRLEFSYDASAQGGNDPANIFWVRPYDLANAAGTPSNHADGTAPGNLPPVISGFNADTNPVISAGTSNLTVTASDPDGDPLTYTYTTTDGTVDDTGLPATVFHAPAVLVSKDVTVTVTVDDGQGGTDSQDVTITVNPKTVTEVHITFGPTAQGGTGTAGDAYGFSGDTDYTFTATDQDGDDITAQTTFSYSNDPPGLGQFPQGAWTTNVLHTNVVGNGTFSVVGAYHQGQPDEIDSNPDLAGEDMHAAIVFLLP